MQGLFSTLIFGLLLILFGILFLLDQTGTIDFDFWDFLGDIWPVALILLGIWIIYNQARGTGTHSGGGPEASVRKIFGTIDVTPKALDSKGAGYSVTFGEIHVYLTKTALPPGESRVSISIGFGETQIILPDNIPCRVNSSCGLGEIKIFGESAGGITANKKHSDDNYDSAEKKISLSVKCGVGEIRINRA